MYKARKMLPHERSKALLEGREPLDAQGSVRRFAVEHESGKTLFGYSWAEACATVRELNHHELRSAA